MRFNIKIGLIIEKIEQNELRLIITEYSNLINWLSNEKQEITQYNIERLIIQNIEIFESATYTTAKYYYQIQIRSNYLLRSFGYYNANLRRSILAISDRKTSQIKQKDNENILNQAINYLKFSLISYINVINSLYEEHLTKNLLTPPKFIALFESSPSDLTELDFITEIDSIENIVERSIVISEYYPIVRYSTNRHIFKECIEDSKPKIIHYSGHGDVYDLAFVSPLGKTDVFKTNSFIECLEKSYKGNLINLVYLNSCNSHDYVRTLKKNKSKNFKILRTMGYTGSNNHYHATNYSILFYQTLFLKAATNVSIAYNRSVKEYLKTDPFYNKKAYLNRLIFTKR